MITVAMCAAPWTFHGVLVFIGIHYFTPQPQLLEHGDKIKATEVSLISSPIFFPDGCNRFDITTRRFFKLKPLLQFEPSHGGDISKHFPLVGMTGFVLGGGQHKVQPIKVQLGGNLIVQGNYQRLLIRLASCLREYG